MSMLTLQSVAVAAALIALTAFYVSQCNDCEARGGTYVKNYTGGYVCVERR